MRRKPWSCGPHADECDAKASKTFRSRWGTARRKVIDVRDFISEIFSPSDGKVGASPEKLVEPRPVLALLKQCGITASFFADWTDQDSDGLIERVGVPLADAEALLKGQGACAGWNDVAESKDDDHIEAQTFATLAESDEERRRARMAVIERCGERLSVAPADLRVTSRGKAASLWNAGCEAMLACQREADATVLELARTFGVSVNSVPRMVRHAKSVASDPGEVVAMQGIEPCRDT